MTGTIAGAIDDSKRQFTDCYRTGTIGTMTHPMTPQVEVLRALVEQAGGPAAFAKKYSAYTDGKADKPIDATYVSQILNGHRAFRDTARRNMAIRAGLPPDYFEQTAPPTKVEQDRAVYQFQSSYIEEAVSILSSLPPEWQLNALRAIRFVASEYNDNNQKLYPARRLGIPPRARSDRDMTNVILLSEWKARNLHGSSDSEN